MRAGFSISGLAALFLVAAAGDAAAQELHGC